jgi:predicted RND superfamily exporter protein
LGFTAFFGFQARKAELSYDYVSAVPVDDKDFIFFQQFKKTFGDDGNILAIGVKDKKIFDLKSFTRFVHFNNDLQKLEGVIQVLSLTKMQILKRDSIQKKFVTEKLFPVIPATQKDLDSSLKIAKQQKFYQNLLWNHENDAMLVLVTIDKKILDSHKRQRLLKDIVEFTDDFSQKTNIQLYLGGLPYIRATVAKQVSAELANLLFYSGIVTIVMLGLFFSSWSALIIPILVIGISVTWSIGFLGILGYKMNLLTGLLPPILVVIGIPNCVYLLNKYHQEYRQSGVKFEALTHVIDRIGMVTLLTNLTTSIGFGVFIFTPNQMLKEFGVIAFLGVMSTFIISVLLLPIFYAYLPAPKEWELKHLDRKPLGKMLKLLHNLVFYKRKQIYIIVITLAIIASLGVFLIKPLAKMLDNVPHHSKPKQDLAFFEDNFKGLMPLEIVIDTKRKKGVMNLQVLSLVEKLQDSLKKRKEIGEPLSLVNFLKATKQAYYNQNADFFELPTNQEKVFILNYLTNVGTKDSVANVVLRTMVDSTGQKMRLSLKLADIGSEKLEKLLKQDIEPLLKSIFKNPKIATAEITGTTKIFIKGNVYLINSLQSSLILAIILIGLIMAALFGSFRMILISICTNILPLAITAGLMGYLGIPLKPSTALIFSIAFGIAVDDSIHYLARYRYELKLHKYNVFKAVEVALRETGASMFYTSIVLFFGFIVFAYSDFEGTIVLGVLTSTTLLCAMVGNLLLLPSLLLSFEKYKEKKMVNS